MLVLIGIGVVALIIVGIFIGAYNSLIALKNDIEKAWSNIDVLLKQRSDELPKLIASVKGYMKHEKGLLTEITKARTDFLSAKTMSQKAKADGEISSALKSIFAVSENYPKLSADTSFLKLHDRISAIENSIADRREFYNDAVNNYNIRIETIPDMLIANMMHLQKKMMFQVSAKEREDVKVEF